MEGACMAPIEEGVKSLITTTVFSAVCKGNWILDSGATGHMCTNAQLITNMRKLDVPQEVTLGDGHTLQGLVEGTVKLETILPDGTTEKASSKR